MTDKEIIEDLKDRLRKAERDWEDVVEANYRLVVYMKRIGVYVPSFDELRVYGREDFKE